jgi:hypothetical protein
MTFHIPQITRKTNLAEAAIHWRRHFDYRRDRSLLKHEKINPPNVVGDLVNRIHGNGNEVNIAIQGLGSVVERLIVGAYSKLKGKYPGGNLPIKFVPVDVHKAGIQSPRFGEDGGIVAARRVAQLAEMGLPFHEYGYVDFDSLADQMQTQGNKLTGYGRPALNIHGAYVASVPTQHVDNSIVFADAKIWTFPDKPIFPPGTKATASHVSEIRKRKKILATDFFLHSASRNYANQEWQGRVEELTRGFGDIEEVHIHCGEPWGLDRPLLDPEIAGSGIFSDTGGSHGTAFYRDLMSWKGLDLGDTAIFKDIHRFRLHSDNLGANAGDPNYETDAVALWELNNSQNTDLVIGGGKGIGFRYGGTRNEDLPYLGATFIYNNGYVKINFGYDNHNPYVEVIPQDLDKPITTIEFENSKLNYEEILALWILICQGDSDGVALKRLSEVHNSCLEGILMCHEALEVARTDDLTTYRHGELPPSCVGWDQGVVSHQIERELTKSTLEGLVK